MGTPGDPVTRRKRDYTSSHNFLIPSAISAAPPHRRNLFLQAVDLLIAFTQVGLMPLLEERPIAAGRPGSR